MSPTGRAAGALAVAALAALIAGPVVAAFLAVALAGAVLADARAARRAPVVRRRMPRIVARGVPATVSVEVEVQSGARRVRVRQASAPDVRLEPGEAGAGLTAELVARRRGRHSMPAVAVRVEGPLRLAAWHHRAGEDAELLVYPDLPAARRLALAVRAGRFRESGRLSRGPLGLGTEFESVRDYLPDDDIRQVNWRATERLGRPMSNQYRIEQDREVICVLDTGRLMAAPVGDRTRLDAAIDAATAVGLVADELGDRCGTLAFDARLHRAVRPRRAGGQALVRAVFDLEPSAVDSDYELAFRHVESSKRALVIVFTDLIEEVAARSLVAAVPVLARRHEVVVAGVTDPDLSAALTAAPRAPADVYAAAAALDVLGARERAASRVRGAGARVLEAPADRLGPACVAEYLRAKARARL